MKDLFDYWISIREWDSEGAALICNSKDPRNYKRQIKFPPGNSNDFSGFKPSSWQWEVLEYYYIFENADWRNYIDEMSDPYLYFRHPKKAWYGHFLAIAKNKGLKLPPALVEHWLSLNSSDKGNEEKEKIETRNKRIFEMALDVVGTLQNENKTWNKDTVVKQIHESGKFPGIGSSTIARNINLKKVKKALK